jgi:hypothetical protein
LPEDENFGQVNHERDEAHEPLKVAHGIHGRHGSLRNFRKLNVLICITTKYTNHAKEAECDEE